MRNQNNYVRAKRTTEAAVQLKMNLGSDALATAVPMRLRTWRGQSRTSWRQTLLTTLTLGKAMTWSARVQKSKNIFQTSLTNDPKCGFFSPKLWFWGLFVSCFFLFFERPRKIWNFMFLFNDFLISMNFVKSWNAARTRISNGFWFKSCFCNEFSTRSKIYPKIEKFGPRADFGAKSMTFGSPKWSIF